MNIDQNINLLTEKYNNLIDLVDENNGQIMMIKKKIITIQNQIKKIKNERYYNTYYKDDLDFQISYYCNIYTYKKGLLIIKKNKIFYDLFIYYNFFRYLIRYCIKHLKSNYKEFKMDIQIEKEISQKTKYNKSDMSTLFKILIENIKNSVVNFNSLNDLLIDLEPSNSSHFLIINNIHNNIYDNFNILKIRFEYGLNNLTNIIDYHIKQLQFFKDSMDSESKFINENIYYNSGNKMKANIVFKPYYAKYYPGQEIQINIKPIQGIDYNSKIGIEIVGSNTMELTKLIDFNNKDGFTFLYKIGDNLGESCIKLYCINPIFGNSIIDTNLESKFYVEKKNEENEVIETLDEIINKIV